MDEIKLYLKQQHTITLKSLGTAGYRWSAIADNPQVVKVDPLLRTHSDGPIQPGRSLDEQFVLTGFGLGETFVHFSQARSFEPEKPPHATYDIKVRVVSP
jgi:hypothetical protein